MRCSMRGKRCSRRTYPIRSRASSSRRGRWNSAASRLAEEVPDYVASRAAAGEMDGAANKDGAADGRTGIAVAEEQNRGNP